MNTFGNQFRLALFGESHGEALGILIDGLPAGIPLDEADFENDLARRRSGAAGTTPRRESDRVRIAAGLYEGRTTGAPLASSPASPSSSSAGTPFLQVEPNAAT